MNCCQRVQRFFFIQNPKELIGLSLEQAINYIAWRGQPYIIMSINHHDFSTDQQLLRYNKYTICLRVHGVNFDCHFVINPSQRKQYLTDLAIQYKKKYSVIDAFFINNNIL